MGLMAHTHTRNILNLDCHQARQELKLWCLEFEDNMLRGDLVLHRTLLFCYCCLVFMAKSLFLSSSHPLSEVQSIEDFCSEHKVNSGDSLYTTLLNLATMKDKGKPVYFLSINLAHQEGNKSHTEYGNDLGEQISLTVDYKQMSNELKMKNSKLTSRFIELYQQHHELEVKVVELQL